MAKRRRNDFLFGGKGAQALADAEVRLEEDGSVPRDWSQVRAAEEQFGKALIRGSWCDVQFRDVEELDEQVRDRSDPPKYRKAVGVWVWHPGFGRHFWLCQLRFLRLPEVKAAAA